MGPLLSLTPWGLQERTSQVAIILDQGTSYNISGLCCPRIIAPTHLQPKHSEKRKSLPTASFPFRWDGELYVSFQLPTDHKPNNEVHELKTKIYIGEINLEIIQTGIVGRPSKKHENEFGRSIEGFIDWQIHCFRELSGNCLNLDELDETTKSVIRRNWSVVRKVWIGNKTDEAIMALIVELAQDRELISLFESVSKNPRHILLRERKNTSVGRIQELDSACIRDFAKRPGRTIYEKAGSRQELLAIQRVESCNTLENRVFTWVLARILERSWSYVVTNRHHALSSRVELVSRYNRRCSQWQTMEKLKNVSKEHLHHPVQPNYTLQMDTRYSRIYKTYKELLREQRVIDDAWEWQRNLWIESARQLMSCAMTEFYPEKYISTPYYRTEGEDGAWTETPAVPGPFKTQNGTCFMVDAKDVPADAIEWIDNPPFDFAPYVGSVGCDQVLYWPKNNTLVVVWFVYWTGASESVASMINSAGLAQRNLTSDLHRYTRTPYKCYGLMLITDGQSTNKVPSVEVDTWPPQKQSETVALKIPFNIDRSTSGQFKDLIEDLKVGIQLAIDMACEREYEFS